MALSYYLREATKRSPTFLWHKINDAILSKAAHLRNGTIFKPYALPRKGVTLNPNFRFFFEKDQVHPIINEIKHHCADEWQKILARCDEYVQGNIQFLGTEPFSVFPTIHWQKDYSTGYEWQMRYFTKYPYSDITCFDADADVKIPWEMARLQMLPPLAIAFLATNDPKYYAALTNYLTQWISANPVGWGLGWRSTMETAIRSINLIWTIQLLENTPQFANDFPELNALLYQHGLFIRRNTEYSDVNGNHHSACLIGLFYLSIYFDKKNNQNINEWCTFAKNRLEIEILTEILPDGLCFEGSIPYHRLVAEFMLHAYILAAKNDCPMSPPFAARLEKTLDAVQYYTQPNGFCPAIGDNDDGQLLKIGGNHLNDHTYLYELKALIFDKTKTLFDFYSQKTHIDTIWLCYEAYNNANKTEIITDRNTPTHHFENNGFYILRQQNAYAFLDCGDTGLGGRGSHGHNDLLHVCLCLNGYSVLIDSGNAAYTRGKTQRIHDLSTAAHNTPIINNNEYATLRTEQFVVARNPKHYHTIASTDSTVSGRIEYDIDNNPVEITRNLRLSTNGTSAEIIDTIETHNSDAEIVWHWHLTPEWLPEQQKNSAYFFVHKNNSDIRLHIVCPQGAMLTIAETAHYPTYNARQKNYTLIISRLQNVMLQKFEFQFSIL